MAILFLRNKIQIISKCLLLSGLLVGLTTLSRQQAALSQTLVRPTISALSTGEIRGINGNAGLELSADNLDKSKCLAMAGDSAEAWKVSLNYFSQSNLDEERYWGAIAAQDGDAKYKAAFGNLLSVYPDQYYMLRSFFWKTMALQEQDGISSKESSAELEAVEFDGVQNIFGKNIASELRRFVHRTRNDPTFKYIKFTPSVVSYLSMMASMGSPGAAASLVSYYQADKKYYEMYYWLNIAAENDDFNSEIFLAETFNVSDSKEDKVRVKFWAKRVLESDADHRLVSQGNNLLQENSQVVCVK
jgi:hypothetical protein